MIFKYIVSYQTPYLLVASFQTYLIYHIYIKMNQVEHMRHMMDKMYTEQLNLKSNLKFTLTKDASTNTPNDNDFQPSLPYNNEIPATSFFSLGNYLNQKKEKE